MFDTGGFAYGAVAVGLSPVVVSTGASRRRSLLVQNVDSQGSVYIGPSQTVTTVSGIRLKPDDSIEFSDTFGPVYAVADEADTDVRYLEFG